MLWKYAKFSLYAFYVFKFKPFRRKANFTNAAKCYIKSNEDTGKGK